jgi:hypothetical protein
MSAQMLAYFKYDMPAARQNGPDAGADIAFLLGSVLRRVCVALVACDCVRVFAAASAVRAARRAESGAFRREQHRSLVGPCGHDPAAPKEM